MQLIKNIITRIKSWWKSKSAKRNQIVIYMATVAELVEKVNILSDKILDKFEESIDEIEQGVNNNEKIS